MANTVYNIFKRFSVSSSSGQYSRINLLSDTIKVTLVQSGYTVDPDHKTYSLGTTVDPESREFHSTGGGYIGHIGGSGRKTLASKTLSQDDTNNRAVFDAADVTWTAINAGTAASCIVIEEGAAGTTTSDTGTMLLFYIDSGFPVTTNGGDLTIQWSTAGLLDLT